MLKKRPVLYPCFAVYAATTTCTAASLQAHGSPAFGVSPFYDYTLSQCGSVCGWPEANTSIRVPLHKAGVANRNHFLKKDFNCEHLRKYADRKCLRRTEPIALFGV